MRDGEASLTPLMGVNEAQRALGHTVTPAGSPSGVAFKSPPAT